MRVRAWVLRRRLASLLLDLYSGQWPVRLGVLLLPQRTIARIREAGQAPKSLPFNPSDRPHRNHIQHASIMRVPMFLPRLLAMHAGAGH